MGDEYIGSKHFPFSCKKTDWRMLLRKEIFMV